MGSLKVNVGSESSATSTAVSEVTLAANKSSRLSHGFSHQSLAANRRFSWETPPTPTPFGCQPRTKSVPRRRRSVRVPCIVRESFLPGSWRPLEVAPPSLETSRSSFRLLNEKELLSPFSGDYF